MCHPDALDVVNYRDAVANLDEDEKDDVESPTPWAGFSK
jgi:hypothetical protein